MMSITRKPGVINQTESNDNMEKINAQINANGSATTAIKMRYTQKRTN